MPEGLTVSAEAKQSAILSVLHEKLNLAEPLSVLAEKYRSAKPFPHIVFDNLFSDELLDRLVEEMPAIDKKKWVESDDEHLTKYNLRSAVELGETGYRFSSFLHSAAFLYFLSEITGIFQLLPDPYLQGSGYHILPRGAKFDIHADRNTAYETGLTRRLSLITYLNKSWPHEYGGQLELWNKDGTRCEAVVEPVFNRTAIFEIGDQYFHGVPAQVACPVGRSRNSWVAYYHTAAHGTQVAPHTSIYSPSFYQNRRRKLIDLGKDLIPPILFRALRKVKGY
ncbi:MAG TPA: 2OG-Fe(II) oxygenase [Terriglobales bacterium]|nr:2OG-Fe(II) oxygenase [Terriglobales bacterium]